MGTATGTGAGTDADGAAPCGHQHAPPSNRPALPRLFSHPSPHTHTCPPPCSLLDYYGWQFAAEAWAASQGVHVGAYRHRVLVTPARQASFMAPGSAACTWSGMAVVGPVGSDSGEEGGGE